MVTVILAIYGGIIGSFVNALVYRMHAHADGRHKTSSKLPASVAQGRSVCSHCGHVLAPRDLVPILSYVVLNGRCRYCRKRIEDTPLPEILLPVCFALSYYFWPYPLDTAAAIGQFGFWLMLLVGFVALTVYDVRWFLLPDKIVVWMVALALGFFITGLMGGDSTVGLFGLATSLVLLPGLFAILFYVSAGSWIGGGDVKLAIALALLVPSGFGAALVLFSASLIGVLATLPQVVRGQKTLASRLPFGPLLITGTVIAVLFEPIIRGWLYV